MISVLKPGFYSTIQDLGRKEFQHLGIPISGAMDQYAAIMANSILGNDKHCAVMEITMVGPVLEFSCMTTISIMGANLSPRLNEREIYNATVVHINKGDLLSFGKLQSGFRTYLAVFDGFQTEVVLKSKSMYQGITNSWCLKKGDKLNVNPKKYFNKANASFKPNISYINNRVIEVYKGPEFDKLSDFQIETLFNQEFTVSKQNNRMAYQFDELIENDLDDIITSLVLPGTVQLTPSGKLIILMKDCQTTGGYPRVLQLSKFAINLIAQKYTGSKIKFKLIS